jgi:hypothetical protein
MDKEEAVKQRKREKGLRGRGIGRERERGTPYPGSSTGSVAAGSEGSSPSSICL